MKREFCAISLSVAAINASAELPLPSPIFPIASGTVLRLVPNSQATCTKGSSTAIMRVQREQTGKLSLIASSELDGKNTEFILPLNADGTGLSSEDPQFNFDKALPDEALKIMKPMLAAVAKQSLFAIGRPLSQNQSIVVVSESICSIFPQGSTKAHRGSFKVMGVALIRGRESVIFKGEETLTCQMNGTVLPELRMSGWSSVDKLSGLYSDTSFTIKMDESTSTDDTECVFADENRPSAPAQRSAEQRLLELKSLLDKGLINQGQYESKQKDVLKSL